LCRFSAAQFAGIADHLPTNCLCIADPLCHSSGRTEQIVMEKIVPNGPRIAQLRRAKGFKQADFTDKVGMSIRKYRDVETKSLSISPRELQEIADKLGVSVEDISSPGRIERAPAPGDREIQLRSVDGTRLLEMAQTSDEYEYQVLAPVGSAELAAILPILRIVRRNCGVTQFMTFSKVPWNNDPRDDGFDEDDFPELRRIACLNDAIEKLKSSNIGILANTYAFRTETDIDTRLCIAFVDSKAKTLNVRKQPDALWRPTIKKGPFDRKVDQEAKPAASFTRELDDDVPF
jgi:transcriptional regulator with XRE-family HTH domain